MSNNSWHNRNYDRNFLIIIGKAHENNVDKDFLGRLKQEVIEEIKAS